MVVKIDREALTSPYMLERLKKPFGKTTSNMKVQVMTLKAILKAVGSVRMLSKMIDESEGMVSLWHNGRRRINASAVVNLAIIFGLDPSILRPDIFPKNTKITFEHEANENEQDN